jgi:WS/DGAT/MGAT family acyltransferase
MPHSRPALARRLTTQDASFLYAESRNAPLHIGSIGIFENELTLADLKRGIQSRLHLLPSYTQKLRLVPFNLNHPGWQDDRDFELDNHLHHHRLPPQASETELLTQTLRVNQKALDRTRPLWEMHLFTGLNRGRCALLIKVHHCMVDGASGIELLKATMDSSADTPVPLPRESRPTAPPAPSRIREFFDTTKDFVLRQADFAQSITDSVAVMREAVDQIKPLRTAATKAVRLFTRRIVPAPWNSVPLTNERSMALFQASVPDLRVIRSAFGGTTNDVALAILGEAAARYLKHHGVTSDLPLRIGCPVSVRRKNERDSLGNRVSMMFPELKSLPMDPVVRLMSVIAETSRIKSAREAASFEALLALGDLIPPSLMSWGGTMATTATDIWTQFGRSTPRTTRSFSPPLFGMNFIVTNVPSVQEPLYLAGRRMESFAGLIPLFSNFGYAVAICTYDQNVCFTLMAEPRLMPDVGLMRLYAKRTFKELRSAALKVKPVERKAAETEVQIREAS